MSWRGFQKAVTRLPHVVLQKAGYAEETFDEDFEKIEADFKEMESLSKRLHEDSKSFLTSVDGLTKAQKNYAIALQQLFADTDSENPSPYTAICQNYADQTSLWIEEVTPWVGRYIQDVAIDPSNALVQFNKEVRALIEKRGRKLIDNDRTHEQMKKAQESKSLDPIKISKAENAYYDARREYDQLNDKLKVDIPHFIHARIDFMDPFLEAMLIFQIHFFQHATESLKSLGSFVDLNGEVIETYTTKSEAGLNILKTLTLVNQRRIDPNSDIHDHGDEKDKEKEKEKPPSYSDAQSTSPTSPASAARDRSSSSSGAHPSSSQAPAAANLAPVPAASRPPPPMPNRATYAVSLYPYQSDTPGDLSFQADEKIEILKRTDNQNDWWTGRIGNRQGLFPANYVRIL